MEEIVPGVPEEPPGGLDGLPEPVPPRLVARRTGKGPEKVLVEENDMDVIARQSRRGRPRRRPSEEQLAEVIRLYFVERLSMRQVADLMGVSHMSVYRMLNDPSLELLI